MKNYNWNLEAIYESTEKWSEDYAHVETLIPALDQHKGSFSSKSGASNIIQTIEDSLKVKEVATKLYNYAHMKFDTELSNSNYQELMEKAVNLFQKIESKLSFFEPELLSLDNEKLEELITHAKSTDYLELLNEIIRYKPHTLSEKEEKILIEASETMQGARNIFQQLNNVDLDFGEIEVDGKKDKITHGTYQVLIKNRNRDIRKEVYEKYVGAFYSKKNTLTAIYSTSVKKDFFLAKTKNYKDCRSINLFNENIPEQVYDNLVTTVSDNIEALHEYYDLKKEVLNLKPLKAYDLSIPLVKDFDRKFKYEEARSLVIESLSPLGKDYCSILQNGLEHEGWVDVFEKPAKRSGAYSSGCYGTYPYILMNYQETIDSMFTLAHEAGHSMQTYYINKTQPFAYSNYSIFVAEVASTFNEYLLFDYLNKKFADDEKLINYLLNDMIETIEGTLFRQTMFAEFELESHRIIENGGALTVQKINEIYSALQTKYFGSSVEFEEYSWCSALRIPHFYSAFYVYKYATGISAAISLATKVLEEQTLGKNNTLNDYLKFLSLGSSTSPLDSLKIAGIDMNSPAPIKNAIDTFRALVKKLRENLK